MTSPRRHTSPFATRGKIIFFHGSVAKRGQLISPYTNTARLWAWIKMKLTGKHKLLDWKLNFTRERWRVDTLGRESNDKVKFFSFSEKMYIHVRDSPILSCGRVKIHIPNMFLFVTGSKYRSSRTWINFSSSPLSCTQASVYRKQLAVPNYC